MSFLKSLRVKTILLALVPTALVLVVVAIIAIYAYEEVARDVVKQRDTELARISAARLSERLGRHSLLLRNTAVQEEVRSMEPARLTSALAGAHDLRNVFDGGLVVYNGEGAAVWSQPDDIARHGADISSALDLEKVSATRSPVFSNVFEEPATGEDVILIGVPIEGTGGEEGVLAGMATLEGSLLNLTYADVLEITKGREGVAYLVDGNGRVIYHFDLSQLGADLSATEPVMQLVAGGDPGAVLSEDPTGKTVISGFAPVPDTGWGVVTQEEWRNIVGPIRDQSRLILGLLSAAVVVSGGLIFLAIGRVLKPIKDLTQGAQRIAGGDFGHTIVARTGDESQALAQQFNTMAGSLKESYADLEQKVAQRTEDVRESEERYRALFEESRDAIFISSQGKIIAVNEAALELFDFTREEAVGSDVGDRYDDPTDQDRFRQAIDQSGSVRDFEVRLRKKNGEVMDCLVTATRRDAKYGTGPGEVQGLVRDITEHKRAEEELHRYAEELARSNADLQQFAYVASHDLQEPLRMVSSYTQLLGRRYKGNLDADADEFIGYAVDGAIRMQDLINDLLAYSRIGTSGKPAEPTDCNHVLDHVINDLRAAIDDSGAVVTHDHLPTVMADESELARLFQNLIANSIKFHGDEQPRVHVSAELETKDWVFSVRDNGIGIEQEYAERIFRVFQRLHTRDKYSGTGIGLAICKRVVEGYGGRIWLESEPGKGSVFYFTIPTREDT